MQHRGADAALPINRQQRLEQAKRLLHGLPLCQ
jgi:hypothetical protein